MKVYNNTIIYVIIINESSNNINVIMSYNM